MLTVKEQNRKHRFFMNSATLINKLLNSEKINVDLRAYNCYEPMSDTKYAGVLGQWFN